MTTLTHGGLNLKSSIGAISNISASEGYATVKCSRYRRAIYSLSLTEPYVGSCQMDAGTKASRHYAGHMAPWRYWLREQFLGIVRKETKYLAKMQNAVRSPTLDTYFAMTANIGTHTFYMAMLPVSFWYGDPRVGLDVIWVLAIGVFLTGFVKDLLCLPRPMSPPLHRISMSGSAMLEYGLPSTHSCNAVSVALVMSEFYPNNAMVFYVSVWLLSTLMFGRLYNGMHGFLDVISGILFGYASYHLRLYIKTHLSPESALDNTIITVANILAISACPSPVDDCPCFDDSVAFSGVVLGLLWTLYVGPDPDSFFDPSRYGKPWRIVLFGVLRFLVGLVVIVVWRRVAKTTLLRILPPIWRFLARFGVRNPRRYFTPATQYSNVPYIPTDDIPDSKRDMVAMIRRIHRSPSVSVGPQSEADLYELRATNSTGARKEIEEPRKHYDVEVFMRLVVYGGICAMALLVAPVMFRVLRI